MFSVKLLVWKICSSLYISKDRKFCFIIWREENAFHLVLFIIPLSYLTEGKEFDLAKCNAIKPSFVFVILLFCFALFYQSTKESPCIPRKVGSLFQIWRWKPPPLRKGHRPLAALKPQVAKEVSILSESSLPRDATRFPLPLSLSLCIANIRLLSPLLCDQKPTLLLYFSVWCTFFPLQCCLICLEVPIWCAEFCNKALI